MAEKKIVVPEILPILPVRDTVLFPGAALLLTAGRESPLATHSRTRPNDRQSGAWNRDNRGGVTDSIAGSRPSLSTLLRQELIEPASVRKRLETLIRELSKELEVLELRSKIHEQVQEQ